MTSESFGCHDFSRRRLGASAGWESCCFGLSEMLPRSLWWQPSSSGCTARGVGATGRGLGVLGVGGAFVQYAQLLVSGSRPSWRRPTRGKTRANSGRGRSRTMTTGPQRRRRAGSGAGGPVTEAPGYAVRTPDSLLRGPVSTALTWTGPTSMFPAGIVGILRFFFGVRIRCAFNVSTLDTNDLPGLFPSAPRHPQDHQPVSGPVRASVSEVMTPTCLRSEETTHEMHRAARAVMNDKPERTPLWFIHICGHRCGNTSV